MLFTLIATSTSLTEDDDERPRKRTRARRGPPLFDYEEEKRLVPALVVLDDDDNSPARTVLLTRPNARVKLGDIKQGRGRSGCQQYNRAYDECGLQFLERAALREYGKSLNDLRERRERKTLARKQQAHEQGLMLKGATEYRRGVEARELEQAVRVTKGLRQSWSKWSISRSTVGMESRAERDARRVRYRKRFTLSSFRLRCAEYLEGFADAVGVNEAEYTAI